MPDANGTPAPITPDGYPFMPQQWHDTTYVAAHLYNLCSRTAGQPWLPARYKFAGSETWIEPGINTAILEHAAAFDGPHATAQNARRGRPDVRFRVKNGAADVWGFDCSRSKFSRETIIVQPVDYPNLTVSMELQGGKLQLNTETI